MVEFKVHGIEFDRITDPSISGSRGRAGRVRGAVKSAKLECPACGHRWPALPSSWTAVLGGHCRLPCPGCKVDGYFRAAKPGE